MCHATAAATAFAASLLLPDPNGHITLKRHESRTNCNSYYYYYYIFCELYVQLHSKPKLQLSRFARQLTECDCEDLQTTNYKYELK